MDNIVKNTDFNNLVNYQIKKSSAHFCETSPYSSADPTSLSYLSKNNQIVEYHLANISEKEFLENEISEPKTFY